ncbi:endonuclease/exonuclease/phosphatase family metal-dependent hydrolase [Dysgonomonas sp. PH5-45]|uniref:endonuclease/exonuclease/phosphatase family protein n=1 Tax=unclassified Dysgonomonas TaxID=2630389 RepID=UPI00247513C0|nr:MULTISPECIES: endonuclease/exonuclease/phosphatase family protein [unclassified Dysgonomonas]MDH6353791.1 endonuclease/exonuclease/phosphatase family metal-dependent hydrolase [Dysgonomonas sp. PH5-45]MDH6386693.1 endonuclease/exonuclease/phosphatase family metal-dependent hydrolase [Dysgonomonas sp. PH5-37]
MPAINKSLRKVFSYLRRYARYITIAFNVVALVLLLCSYLAWSVSPAQTTAFAYIGIGFIFVFVVNILFVLLWFIVGLWKYGLVALVCILLCWKPILTYFPMHGRTKDVPEDCFKLLSYNVFIFNWDMNWKKGPDQNPIIKYINDSDADIVCLQEFAYEKKKRQSLEQVLKETFPDYPYSSIVNLRARESNIIYGLLCLSKYPIESSTQIPIEARDNGAVLCKLNVKGKTVSLFINHLESNRITANDKKLYSEFMKEKTAEKFDSVTHNIRQKLNIAYQTRARQADLISEWIKNQDSDAIIVCGDFNDTPISYAYNRIKGDLNDAYYETGFGPGISYHANYFWFRIDHIMHSQNLEAFNCTVDRSIKNSDHYPIYSYLRFKD